MEISSSILSDITVHMKYSKFMPEVSRREVWGDIVTRNMLMHLKKFPSLANEIKDAYKFVYDKKVLPSMRSMQFAGKPIELNPARIYNCSFLPMNDPVCFAELMFLLLSGCGVGYSVQSHHVEELPEIRKPTRTRRYLVGDSIEGWADSVKILMRAYFEGKPLPVFDFSDIRPKGAALVTAGGKAPGPEPLRECLSKIQKILDRKSDGGYLTPLEVHDINCIIADAVLAGGIRRSAMIALFDLDDQEMLTCKSDLEVEFRNNIEYNDNNTVTFYVEYHGERHSVTLSDQEFQKFLETRKLPWFNLAPHRGRANNSAVILRHKIDRETFFDLWRVIEASGSGEPGFFMSNDKNMGLNPCAEISLRPFQFCNLVTINASDVETQEELEARTRAATFIATLQASYTNFHYLRDIWKTTTEKEALIGVSMTGIASGRVLSLDLDSAAKIVKSENSRVAKLIGINPAARCTTVKPEGTSSLVLGSSSGIHAWHSDYYMRRIRVGKNEPIYHYLVQTHPELLEDEYFRPHQQAIIKVPIKAPEGAITRHESALDLLDRVSHVWKHWVKPGHRKGSNVNNVSTTVTIKPDEWNEVGEWMWEHRDEYTALSVLPFDNGSYIQAPFTDISKEEYEEAFKLLSAIDLTQIIEDIDGTSLQSEIACSGPTGCTVI
jgi:ribonucleoside-triphosphate reductase